MLTRDGEGKGDETLGEVDEARDHAEANSEGHRQGEIREVESSEAETGEAEIGDEASEAHGSKASEAKGSEASEAKGSEASEAKGSETCAARPRRRARGAGDRSDRSG